MKTIGYPRGIPIDRLIADFSNQKTLVIYIYATHDVKLELLTHKKDKNDEPIVKDEESE